MSEKSFVATSLRFKSCNKLKKSSIGIRVHLATLGLGRNSGPSGDFKTHPVDTAIAEGLSWTNPDVCRVDRRREAIRSPEADGGGVSAE
jgi:hypothetical protein